MLEGFALIMMPTSAIMGFALATVGFTCWNLAVPLYLNLFAFHLFDALFLTVLMDLTGSLVLGYLYSRKGRVDFGFVLRFGPICGLVAFTSAKLGEPILLSHQKLLKGTVGYIPFLYAVAFLAKARTSLREGESGADAPDAFEHSKSSSIPLTARYGSSSDDEVFIAMGNGDAHDHADRPNDGDGHAKEHGAANGQADEHARGVPGLPHPAGIRVDSDDAWPDTSQERGAWLRGTLASVWYSPILENQRRRVSPAAMRAKLVSCAACMVGCGVIGGILYFGGGVIFVTVILFLFYHDDLPLVTGTGCMLMSCVCLGLMATFIDRPAVQLDSELPTYAALVLPCVMLGTALSSHMMLYLSRTSVLLLVSLVALVMGVLITFQRQIFAWAVVD
ncbi:hypothetical protein T492DRAFT_1011154 [Pavlovales sp. CCMP2436]|nr:hypothetical protein T492DRAFT_1011154 [Pavlovales sp. CCMP2436]